MTFGTSAAISPSRSSDTGSKAATASMSRGAQAAGLPHVDVDHEQDVPAVGLRPEVVGGPARGVVGQPVVGQLRDVPDPAAVPHRHEHGLAQAGPDAGGGLLAVNERVYQF